jgi:anti-sigma factor RsiW
VIRRRRRDMVCRQLVELVTAYLDGALSARDRARFEAHLDACDDCAAYVAQFTQTVAALGAPASEPPDPALVARLLAIFRRWIDRGGAPAG